MRVDQILISVSPGETRIATLHKGQLAGLTFERCGQGNMVGDILIGRVEAVVDNLQAAFVNIGEDISGFLELSNTRPDDIKLKGTVENFVAEGDLILVQVTRDQDAGKGAKLSSKPILTGHQLVFAPPPI